MAALDTTTEHARARNISFKPVVSRYSVESFMPLRGSSS